MSRVVHFEIQADRPERAIRFYQAVFGWRFSRWEAPVDYWLITTGPDEEPGINGGLMRRQVPLAPPAPAGQLGYVCTVEVPSVDETATRVEASGGGVAMSRMAVPGVGWLVYLRDTEGNVFGAMQNDPDAR